MALPRQAGALRARGRRLATQTGQLSDPPAQKGGLEGAPVDSFACLFRRACVLVAICDVRCLGLTLRGGAGGGAA
jgi:hypothetical protein